MICCYESNGIQLQKQLPNHVPATQKNSTVVNQLIVIEKPNKKIHSLNQKYFAPNVSSKYIRVEVINLLRYSNNDPYIDIKLTAIIQLIFANNAEMISLKVEGNSLRL